MGFLKGLLKVGSGIANFVKDNEFLTAIGVTLVAGALAPDELDIMKERQKLEEGREARDLKRQNANRMVGDIRLGSDKSRASEYLESQSTPATPMGILNNGRYNPRFRRSQ